MFCGQILQQIHQGIGNKPWALLGDFNSVRYTDEKVEGKQISFSQLSSFNSFVDHCSLQISVVLATNGHGIIILLALKKLLEG